MEAILTFITGLDVIPPLGFQPEPSITFGHPDTLEPGDWTKDYPVVNVCSHSIRLPVVDTYETFTINMSAAIEMATTFTRQ